MFYRFALATILQLSCFTSHISVSAKDAPEAPALAVSIDKLFLPKNYKTVSPDEIAIWEGLMILAETSSAFTGVVEARYADGRLKLRREVLGGRAHGAWLEWHENGRLRHFSEWKDGLGEGPFLYFYESGALRARSNAQADRWHGLSEGWSEDGSKDYSELWRDGEKTADRRYDDGDEVGSPSVTEPWQHDALRQAGRITLTPGFSPDGRTLYLAQTECVPIGDCPQSLKVSRLGDTGWTAPERVPLLQDGRVDYPSVTPDGRSLLFSWTGVHPTHVGRDVREDFSLWRLDLTVPGAAPEPLKGLDINRVRTGAVRTLRFVNNETAPVQTRDGELFFWTERLDGPGERDIYSARPDGSGGFLTPRPLPAPINSSSREDGAWVDPDGQFLLFTTPDRGGCGGSDIFIAFRGSDEDKDGWSTPRNLGCDINSAYDDGMATRIPGTDDIVFMSTRPAPGIDDGAWSLWRADFGNIEAGG